jgi:hypothetical protein
VEQAKMGISVIICQIVINYQQKSQFLNLNLGFKLSFYYLGFQEPSGLASYITDEKHIKEIDLKCSQLT